MKLLVVGLAFFVCSAYGDVSELGYNYHEPASPAPAPVEPEITYIPAADPGPAATSDNSYLAPEPAFTPGNSYVPPMELVEPPKNYIPAADHASEPALINSYVPPSQPQSVHNPANSYVPSESVLPHVEEAVSTYIPPAPVAPEQPSMATEEIEITPEDGYHYKTARRVVYRQRS